MSDPPAFDTHALMARLRRPGAAAEAETAQAFRIVFGTDLGRYVLMRILADAGVGQRVGPGLTPDDRAWSQGRHDGALEIMARAGFDQASAVNAVLTDQLEGRDDERSSYADPEPSLDEDE